jgi:diadenosine tetraphosphate (Ap4A) HIT family hydrolase
MATTLAGTSSPPGQRVPHAHLHVVPRWADEPHAGKGTWWLIKQLTIGVASHRHNPAGSGVAGNVEGRRAGSRRALPDDV